MMLKGGVVWFLAFTLALTACAPTSSPGSSSRRAETGEVRAPKRMTAAIMGDAHTVAQKLNPASYVPGIDTLEELVSAGLTNPNEQGVQRPQLAEASPTIENGLWRLLPDGRMGTTWRIREGARWHDGTPFSTADLLFTLTVAREQPEFGDSALNAIAGVETPDSRTVAVTWREPLIRADAMFSRSLALPLPRHILERPFLEERAGFTELPYWSQEFVGTGPYKLREFARGSHLVLEANDEYVLGRPKVDVIEVKFIPDSKTLMSNILAGAVELTLGRNLSLEEGMQVRDQWRDGNLYLNASGAIQLHPQFVSPGQPLITNLPFRQALYHAIDRDELANGIQRGEGIVAHTFVVPNQSEFGSLEGSIVRYEYDARKAIQLLEGLGLARGPDGFFREAGGQRLSVEVIGAGGEANLKSVPIVADFWRRIGVETGESVVPVQRQRDFEWTANYPGFELSRRGADLKNLTRYHSSQVPTAERNFQGTNVPRYVSGELDELINRYHGTIAFPERMGLLSGIVRHVSENLVLMTLFYDKEVTMIGSRLQNVNKGLSSTQAWNAEMWDVAPGATG